MKCLTFLIVTVIAFAATGVSGNGRMTNGAQASAGDFPYMVSVTTGGEHICGGFIYNRDWVVTSASCVYQYLPSQIRITVAQLSLINEDPEEKIYPIYLISVFEGYDYSSGLHDIAMLQTSSPIEFSTNVNFIPYSEAKEAPSDIGTFIGWGATYEGGLATARLRSIQISFGSDCRDYGADQFYPAYMICAGGSAVDTGSPCHYDEGSPLVQNISGTVGVVGIMSKNAGCGTNFQPTIYTRMSPYYPWFNKLAGEQPTLKQLN